MTRRGILLDLLLPNKEKLAGDVILHGSLSCSGHETTGFKTLKEVRMTNNKIKILELRRVDFGLLGKLSGSMLCKVALKCRGTWVIWLMCKGIFLKAQELSPNTRKQAGIAGGRFEQRTPDLILKEVERGR